jgi:hypothetical protein
VECVDGDCKVVEEVARRCKVEVQIRQVGDVERFEVAGDEASNPLALTPQAEVIIHCRRSNNTINENE